MNMNLLESILTAYGATGREGCVRQVIEKALEGHVDSMETDAMGSLIAVKKGDGTGKRIMLSAHMDHIGLMVMDADKHGYLRVCNVGGIRPANMVAQHVVFENGAVGVVGADEGVKGALEMLADRVGMQYDGLSLGVKCEDEVSGPLTCNLGILRYNEQNGLYATLDIRYPILCAHQALTANIVAALDPAVKVEVNAQKDPHHVAATSKLVTALMESYIEVTGETDAKPMAMGGGTYAKMLEEGVAFGSLFPDEEELAHQAGEYISIDSLVKNLYIFVKAIEKLQD